MSQLTEVFRKDLASLMTQSAREIESDISAVTEQPQHTIAGKFHRAGLLAASKSQRKREAHALRDLGSELVALKPHLLEKIPLPDPLKVAVQLAQRLKREGLRRQLSYIGKLLRATDVNSIQSALTELQQPQRWRSTRLRQLEQLRDQLMAEGDVAINVITQQFPRAERQRLRSLVRAAQREQKNNLPAKACQEIFHYLKRLEIEEGVI